MKQASIYSMTGFASVRTVVGNDTLSIEFRSINSRFLDLAFRMPDDLRPCEPLLREKLSGKLNRGKVECRISWGRATEVKAIPAVNLELVKQLSNLETQLQGVMPQLRTLSTNEVLNWPGVIEDNSVAQEQVLAEIGKLADDAIDQLIQTRAREGQGLANTMLEKVASMEAIVADLAPQIPNFVQAYEAKIREKMTESLNKLIADKGGELPIEDLEERIKHEVALYSVRVDVQEELDRLTTHFKEIKRVVSKGGTVGKRLDFICQELNREANTLGSKANAFAQTQSAVDLKVLIEQFREQVQNLE